MTLVLALALGVGCCVKKYLYQCPDLPSPVLSLATSYLQLHRASAESTPHSRVEAVTDTVTASQKTVRSGLPCVPVCFVFVR